MYAFHPFTVILSFLFFLFLDDDGSFMFSFSCLQHIFLFVPWIVSFLIDLQKFYVYTSITNPLLVSCVANIFSQFVVFVFYTFHDFFLGRVLILFNSLQSQFCPQHPTDNCCREGRSTVRQTEVLQNLKLIQCGYTLQTKTPKL